MQRYVALVWDPDDASATEAAGRLSSTLRGEASRWTCAVTTEGLLVFHRRPKDDSGQAHILPEGAGVVLGRVFRRTSDLAAVAPCTEFDRLAARRMVRTRGQSLVDGYWGRYVAFLYDRAHRLHHVVRDPSGQVPCLWWPIGRITIFFSDLPDVLSLADSPPAIHWPSVTAFLLNEGMRLRQSGFERVAELFAGECLTLDGERALPQSIWEPATVSTERIHHDWRAAAADLRTVTESCIHAWARSENVLLSLSGGFDSAVVLSCLMRAPSRPQVTAVNRYTPRPGEDERAFARAATGLAGVELIECEWGLDGVSLERLIEAAPVIERPSVQVVSALDLGPRRRMAERCRATALWSGQGGDHLFFQMRTDLLAVDRLQRSGPKRGLLAAIDEAARLARKSYASVLWTVLSESFGRSLRIAEPARDPADTFLSAAAHMEAVTRSFTHPWICHSEGLPPGKRLQVAGLVDLVHRRSPCSLLELAPDFHPLISQPLMETCLRIPTDLLLYRGRTRGLAREAFRDRLPQQIVERDSKGTITSYYLRIIRENAQEIWKLLRDGLLAGEQLLDQRKVERCLVRGQPLRPAQLYPLLACVAAEIWSRQAARFGH